MHQDGSDDREKVEARGLAGAKRAWRYETRRGDTKRGEAIRSEAIRSDMRQIRYEARRSDAFKPDGKKGTTRVTFLSKYMRFKYCK